MLNFGGQPFNKVALKWVSILSLSSILTGCGAVATDSHSTANTATQTTTGNDTHVNLSVDPSPPLARHEVKITVAELNTSGDAFKPKKVWINESMTGMKMLPMKTTLKSVSPNSFTGSALFVMSGKWKLTVHLQSGSVEQTYDFLIEVKQP